MSLYTATEAYSTKFSSLSRKTCSKNSQCKRAFSVCSCDVKNDALCSVTLFYTPSSDKNENELSSIFKNICKVIISPS